jgi:hypothetical protein
MHSDVEVYLMRNFDITQESQSNKKLIELNELCEDLCQLLKEPMIVEQQLTKIKTELLSKLNAESDENEPLLDENYERIKTLTEMLIKKADGISELFQEQADKEVLEDNLKIEIISGSTTLFVLPSEILTEIFKMLSGRQQLLIKCVSKDFCNIINDIIGAGSLVVIRTETSNVLLGVEPIDNEEVSSIKIEEISPKNILQNIVNKYSNQVAREKGALAKSKAQFKMSTYLLHSLAWVAYLIGTSIYFFYRAGQAKDPNTSASDKWIGFAFLILGCIINCLCGTCTLSKCSDSREINAEEKESELSRKNVFNELNPLTKVTNHYSLFSPEKYKAKGNRVQELEPEIMESAHLDILKR